ncbi:response regulator transcription factor [Saccharomonospora xinjiangensis]|uniref:Response regulator containing a CheY-like receiver domain and an HTH DNA-binding domain n=1 Tax=Saccharomonospora xinjiangensis XJ-54 TaxID=882086 RepID=I0V2D1_9PSEU|nr:response regulator transcription factor [Saccharomonospora xinjiangensis]EID54284.1 response regulator containing a CheY-like receiver domain and an HTH DNA-binding domain [Saccharomonospora xinjiangensis XJ-54]
MTIRVVVADDQQLVREGLVALLELMGDVTVVGQAANGNGVLDVLERKPCDVVLMDLRMPVLDGVAATRLVRTRHPEVAVLVLTTYSDDDSIHAALTAGARGYLTKDAGRAEIHAALHAVVAGQSTFGSEVSQRLVAALAHRFRPGVSPETLTAREREVLTLIGAGLSNRDIARKLYVAETTVKTHINNAFAKIGARNRADAVRYAYDAGLACGAVGAADDLHPDLHP